MTPRLRSLLGTRPATFGSLSVQRLQAMQAELREEIESILDPALAAGDRALTAAESAEVAQAEAQHEAIEVHLHSGTGHLSRGAVCPITPDPDHPARATMPTMPTVALSPRERFVDLPAADGGPREILSVGKFLRGIVTGRWDGAEAEQRLAMSGSSNISGGYLIPEQMAGRLIDMARARSVVTQAGAVTIPMESDRLVMARQASDATYAAKGENDAFTVQELGFDAVGFTARLIGCVVGASRELAEDAPNFAAIVESAMAAGLAAEIDRLCLVGDKTTGISGLVSTTGVGSTGSVGAIAWEDLHGAVSAIRALNYEPSAIVLHPTIADDLAILAAGDGESSAKSWLGPPPSLDGIRRLTTTAITTALAAVGQWDQFAIALRQQARIEVTTQAGESFERHQVLFKVTWRGDCNCLQAGAFHVLSGITT